MTSEPQPKENVDTAAADPFLAKLRTLRESLPETGALHYRLMEMERRLLEMAAEPVATG